MHLVIVAPPILPIPPVRGGSVQIYDAAICGALAPVFRASRHTNWQLTLVSPGQKPAITTAEFTHIQIDPNSEDYLAEVQAILKDLRPDLIQIENRPRYVPLIAMSCPRARIVLNMHSTTILQKRRISRTDATQCLQQAHAVVCNSRFLHDTIAATFSLNGQTWRSTVIHPGVDIERFRAITGRSRPHQPLRVLFLGRVIREKGLHVGIEAIRMLHREKMDVQLTVVGQAPDWQKKYAAALQRNSRRLPVDWRGFVEPDDLGRILRHHDVLICPSQTREAFGLVNVEAMAAGLPVIASHVGGIPEVVDVTCGVLVRPVNQPAKFATAIRKVASAKVWRVLHEGATRRAAQFTWNRTAQHFTALYESLLRDVD
jgi:spore coat protein SA